jgi:hypothetical protein
MPTAAQLAVAAVVAANHVHCISKGSSDAFSGTVLFAVVLGMRALRAVDLPKDGQATSQSLLEQSGTVT